MFLSSVLISFLSPYASMAHIAGGYVVAYTRPRTEIHTSNTATGTYSLVHTGNTYTESIYSSGVSTLEKMKNEEWVIRTSSGMPDTVLPVPTPKISVDTVDDDVHIHAHTEVLWVRIPQIDPLYYPRMWANIYYDDSSIQRFVSPTHPLKNEKYEPENLVSLESVHISENGRAVYVRAEAATALYLLAADFQEQFKTPLVVISGHRSYAYQQRLWDLGKCTVSLCAIPGRSEHQLGLAVDVFEASNVSDFYKNKTLRQYIRWLQDHAHTYGYTQSYQYGIAVDGYQVEPWHWRYVGIPLATTLYEKKWTLTQYVQFQNMLEAVRR